MTQKSLMLQKMYAACVHVGACECKCMCVLAESDTNVNTFLEEMGAQQFEWKCLKTYFCRLHKIVPYERHVFKLAA